MRMTINTSLCEYNAWAIDNKVEEQKWYNPFGKSRNSSDIDICRWIFIRTVWTGKMTCWHRAEALIMIIFSKHVFRFNDVEEQSNVKKRLKKRLIRNIEKK